MNIDSKEFQDKLNAFCSNNWKAGKILECYNSFTDMPERLQRLFLKEMQIDSVEKTIRSKA